MALKPFRFTNVTDPAYFVNAITGASTTVMDPGGILVATTGTPSGEGLDTATSSAEYATNGSGRVPVGILMTEVVNIDQSRQFINPFKDQVQIGNKVTVLRKGQVLTNMIVPNSATGISTPVPAYVGNTGLLTPNSGVGYRQVGEFLSRTDSEGYAKVKIDL